VKQESDLISEERDRLQKERNNLIKILLQEYDTKIYQPKMLELYTRCANLVGHNTGKIYKNSQQEKFTYCTICGGRVKLSESLNYES